MRISDWSSDVCSSDLPHNLGSVGVTRTSAANAAVAEADLIIAIGTRRQDFTTGSRLLIPGGHRLVQINVAPFDAVKHGAEPVVADARLALEALGEANAGHCVPPAWSDRLTALGKTWAGEAASEVGVA